MGGSQLEALHAAVHSRGDELLAGEAERCDAAHVLALRRVEILHTAKDLSRGNAPKTNAVVLAARGEEMAVGRGSETGDGSFVVLEGGVDLEVIGGRNGD